MFACEVVVETEFNCSCANSCQECEDDEFHFVLTACVMTVMFKLCKFYRGGEERFGLTFSERLETKRR